MAIDLTKQNYLIFHSISSQPFIVTSKADATRWLESGASVYEITSMKEITIEGMILEKNSNLIPE